MATTREELHKLLDELADDRLDEARMALALLNVPEVDEPLTEEELESIREGRAAYARGEYVTNDELKRRMGW
ncbi:MAG: hypothetical protein U0893_06905 [Chloroflexota bacterium]